MSNRCYKERSSESDPLFPRIFLFVHVVFSTVVEERFVRWLRWYGVGPIRMFRFKGGPSGDNGHLSRLIILCFVNRDIHVFSKSHTLTRNCVETNARWTCYLDRSCLVLENTWYSRSTLLKTDSLSKNWIPGTVSPCVPKPKLCDHVTVIICLVRIKRTIGGIYN